MKTCFAALLLLAALTSASRADAEKRAAPNQLTPEEADDGWLLLYDGKTTTGWQAAGGSKWAVAKGTVAPQGPEPGVLVSTVAFAEYEFEADYRLDEVGQATLRVICDRDGGGEEAREVRLLRPGAGWSRLHVTVSGDLISEWWVSHPGDPRPVRHRAELPESMHPRTKHLALVGSGVTFRTLKLRPHNARDLLSGKDFGLAWWTEITGNNVKVAIGEGHALLLAGSPVRIQNEGDFPTCFVQAKCKGTAAETSVLRICGHGFRLDSEWTTVTVVLADGHKAAWMAGRQTADEPVKEPSRGPLTLEVEGNVSVQSVRHGYLPAAKK